LAITDGRDTSAAHYLDCLDQSIMHHGHSYLANASVNQTGLSADDPTNFLHPNIVHTAEFIKNLIYVVRHTEETDPVTELVKQHLKTKIVRAFLEVKNAIKQPTPQKLSSVHKSVRVQIAVIGSIIFGSSTEGLLFTMGESIKVLGSINKAMDSNWLSKCSPLGDGSKNNIQLNEQSSLSDVINLLLAKKDDVVKQAVEKIETSLSQQLMSPPRTSVAGLFSEVGRGGAADASLAEHTHEPSAPKLGKPE